MADETNHTPGPWRASFLSPTGKQWTRPQVNAPDRHIAIVTAGWKIREFTKEGVANAHLIAAAPDLLQACKILLRDQDNNPCNPPNPEECGLCFAAQAIAKAEGKLE